MTPERDDPSLMRRYIERRVPLADNRLLAQFGTMLAEAWAVGAASQNSELLGVIARMLFFLEQCAIDGGKSQLAWLLCGWQEPAQHLMVNHRRQPGLQPFSRLCAPAWVSGNLAYLKDLDFMESRLNQVSKPSTPKPRKPKRPKGKGKGDGANSAAAPAPAAPQ
jgi:hypothetical protein